MNRTSLNVVAVEDDARYRMSLEALLGLSPDFAVAGSFASPAPVLAAIEVARRRGQSPSWDLVLMDLELPDMSGVEATRRIKQLLPDMPVVVVTVFEEPATVLEAICAGADGYLTKRASPEELLGQLRSVAEGGSPLTAGVARTVLELLRQPGQKVAAAGHSSRPDLTEREHEVLHCLVAGMAYKQVASHLEISIDTVRSHIRHIYRKLQVHNVAEAVTRAIRQGLA